MTGTVSPVRRGDGAGFDTGVFSCDGDGAFASCLLVSQEGGHEFDCAGWREGVVDVFGVENFASEWIEEQCGFGE